MDLTGCAYVAVQSEPHANPPYIEALAWLSRLSYILTPPYTEVHVCCAEADFTTPPYTEVHVCCAEADFTGNADGVVLTELHTNPTLY